MKLGDYIAAFGQPFAFYPSICKRAKVSTNAAVFLCMIGWKTVPSSDGWVKIDQDQIENETGLSSREQRTARRDLVKANWLEEKRDRLKHEMFYRVVSDGESLTSLTAQTEFRDEPKESLREEQKSTSSIGKEKSKERPKEEGVRKRASAPSLPREVEIWNGYESLPKVQRLNESRTRSLKKRLEDEFWRENVSEAIDRISKTPFCLGVNDRKWKASFDWLLRPDSLDKVMEGKYGDPVDPASQGNGKWNHLLENQESL